MVTLIYRPQPGGYYMAPELAPGGELTVTAAEAERLLATGQFEKNEGLADEAKPARRKT